jgi:hypothetical protein
MIPTSVMIDKKINCFSNVLLVERSNTSPFEADITHVIYKRLKILKLIIIGPRICWRIEGVCRSAKAEFHTGSGCKKPIPDLMDH